jgi:VIT1/CCC1 family predicted Fe2+/Mn2+ transporter
VLAPNDGIISTGNMVVGVTAAGTSPGNILVMGVTGLVAGTMSMATSEYVSVHSKIDTGKADLSLERAELEADPAAEP